MIASSLLRRSCITRSGRPYLIRPTGSEDAEALIRLRDSVAAEGDGIAAAPGEKTAMEENLSLSSLLSQGGLSLVAVLGGTIAGHLVVERHCGKYDHHVADVGIVISAADRGEGLGRALMETCIDWARTVGVTKLSLGVFSRNHRALRFYRSLGFAKEGLRRAHVRMPDGYRDLVVMGMCL